MPTARLPADPGEGMPLYHRLKSPTQSCATAVLQRRSQSVHGLPYGHSWGGGGLYPIVKAYSGRQPDGHQGVQLWSPRPPDVVFPTGLCYWREADRSARQPHLRIEGDRAILSVCMPPLSTRYRSESKESAG